MPQTANIRDCSAVAQSSGNRSRHSGDPNLVKLQPVACASLYPWYGTATCARGHCVASPLAASKDGKKKNPCQYCTDVKLDTTHNIHTPKTMCKKRIMGSVAGLCVLCPLKNLSCSWSETGGGKEACCSTDSLPKVEIFVVVSPAIGPTFAATFDSVVAPKLASVVMMTRVVQSLAKSFQNMCSPKQMVSFV
eukprot:CAMPEP_0174313250 /NCGR_PEP_ID=MMETSP0810-20121108/4854_1 /TAXON_ID=73025 ORGANISM="Eutreptiella gymnastica-like, Strain CCMP1594" /NCGR_SAMPLE_ID=MMETSP0810 /ASSEMBLY_ACC=CAM_ASM_000659 /LENGTH=191 /DNA_ID=CAMNT_0015421959 /DNA_START=1920 /DNA_END=2496 /DNA_ORIENTATION=-